MSELSRFAGKRGIWSLRRRKAARRAPQFISGLRAAALRRLVSETPRCGSETKR